jgi:hypothetical protein
MQALLAELRSLDELYGRLKNALTALGNSLQSQNLAALTDATLRYRDLFMQLGQMNARADRIAQHWNNSAGSMEPAIKEQILSLAAKVKEEGTQVSILCTKLHQQLQHNRGAYEKRLDEVRKGRSYLHSARPLKTNYPKFLDSLG